MKFISQFYQFLTFILPIFLFHDDSELKLKKYDEMQLRLEEKEKEIRTNLKNKVLKRRRILNLLSFLSSG